MIELEVALETDHPQAEVVSEAEWQGWFSQWGQHLAGEGAIAGSPIDAYELCLKLTTDADIAQLNQGFRQIDGPTDVLSFAAMDLEFPVADEFLASEPLNLGDIIISLDTASRQAADAGHSLRWETAWLAAHGFLHLLGWDHPDDASLATMLDKQTELLKLVGLKSEKVG